MCEMATPIYKVYQGKYLGAWYQLSPQEQSGHNAKIEQALQEVGGERLIFCASVWCSEKWLFWGVEKFPDMEAAQKHAQLLWEMGHYHYIESESYLGTKWPPE